MTAHQTVQLEGNIAWDGMHRPQLYYAMAALFSGLFMAVMVGTVCNVALPDIGRELGVSSSDSIWIVNAFQLVVMMTILPFAQWGELVGYKKVYLRGMYVFMIGSVCCMFSDTLLILVLSRMFQGVGAAMVMSVNTSLVRLIYPKRHLAKGLGLNATVVALAAMAGPSIAAAILSVADWPWLFAINLPMGLLTLWLGHRYLPDNPTQIAGRSFSMKAAILNMATFGLLIGGLEAYSHGLPLWMVMLGVCLFVPVVIWFVRDQLAEPFPMLPFDLLSIPIFSLSVLTSIVSFTAQMLAMIALPFMLQQNLGYDVVETGLLMTAWPAVILLAAPLSGWLVGHVHPGWLGGVGLTMMCMGCFSLGYLPEDVTTAGLVLRLMLCGAGFGLFQSPNNSLMLGAAPTYRAGSASGMLALARLIGQTTGATLVALLFHVYEASAPFGSLRLAGILTLAGVIVSCSRVNLKRV